MTYMRGYRCSTYLHVSICNCLHIGNFPILDFATQPYKFGESRIRTYEPTSHSVNDLANRHIRPLWHLSKASLSFSTISRLEGGQTLYNVSLFTADYFLGHIIEMIFYLSLLSITRLLPVGRKADEFPAIYYKLKLL